MELTLENLQTLLADLSSIIQVFLFLLGVLLIAVPLVVTFPIYHGKTLISSTRQWSRQLGLHHLYKRVWHYFHLWVLMALEELGLFGLFDTISYWFSLSDDNCDNNSNPSITATSIFSDSTTIETSSRQPFHNTLNYQLANVCISSPKQQDSSLIVSGLVNTGNTCYLNSVLQALSSLPRLQLYLDQMNKNYTNQSLPVTRSLFKTLRLLSRPLDEQYTNKLSFRPIDIVAAINTVNHRVINREQQDAHELFQLLCGAMDNERTNAVNNSQVGGGLKDLLMLSSSPARDDIFNTRRTTDLITEEKCQRQHDNPFTGLLANRLSCIQCGYTEAIRHFSFNNIQLTLPQTSFTTLHECLEQMTEMEHLDDASCRRCSMVDFVRRLSTESELLKQNAKQCKDPTIKRETLSKMVQIEIQRRELDHRLKLGCFEDDEYVKGKQQLVPYRLIYGKSTKQAMFAKPPKVLCLHISRSAFHPSGVIYKNKCQLEFPEYLDMDQFCTNGTLNTVPKMPISRMDNKKQQVKYKLMSVIVHYGSHNYGHFIAYKRRVVSEGCGCHQCRSNPEDCILYGKETWYRISDENVDICTIDEVLSANPYMLLYESIQPPIIEPSSSTTSLSSLTLHTSTNRISTHPSTLVAGMTVNEKTNMTTMTTLQNRFDGRISTFGSMTPPISPSSSLSSASSSPSISPSTSSNTNELLAASSTSSTVCVQQQQQQSKLGSSRLVHRNAGRRKMSWEEQSVPPLAIY
ncbi:uncharacterized protein BX664DRAFT_294455 [Halteromyces radiatus]|uniref:uncharacterized protein n=1 Tax=Halteromyces radiatus TaxID=101107 RepID=UPI002220E715|nr:uncharacterized protein BX664DRAFT_294455 [Halteromyces radiatus]KAI8093006.1 hypothetical protein BX664DRAFT_294455 [Halteromyces radiatus]